MLKIQDAMPSVSFSLGRSTLVQALGSNADENVQLHFSRNSGVPNRGNRRLDCTVVVGVCEEMDADATGWGCLVVTDDSFAALASSARKLSGDLETRKLLLSCRVASAGIVVCDLVANMGTGGDFADDAPEDSAVTAKLSAVLDKLLMSCSLCTCRVDASCDRPNSSEIELLLGMVAMLPSAPSICPREAMKANPNNNPTRVTTRRQCRNLPPQKDSC